jgi:hypothetical protein
MSKRAGPCSGSPVDRSQLLGAGQPSLSPGAHVAGDSGVATDTCRCRRGHVGRRRVQGGPAGGQAVVGGGDTCRCWVLRREGDGDGDGSVAQSSGALSLFSFFFSLSLMSDGWVVSKN